MPKPVARSAILFGLVFLTQIAVAQLVTPPPESAENPVTEQKRVRFERDIGHDNGGPCRRSANE